MEDSFLTKLVITNRKALLQKYQRSGFQMIQSALEQMRVADRKRGIRLVLGYLDSPTSSFAGISDPMNQWRCKRTIDALYQKHGRPDYVMLLGGPDIVPFQDLVNPCVRFGDRDAVIPSDLPYACDEGHGMHAEDFLTPSRVVGRLPDAPGATDARYLVKLILRAASAPLLDNRRCFALSSKAWKGATEEGLRRSFPGAAPLVWSTPPKGPIFNKTWLKRSFHLINCLGRPEQFGFFSRVNPASSTLHVAMTPDSIKDQLGTSTVVAAACSYGAQLHATHTPSPRLGMALTYLGEGALAYVGSSTATYGGLGAEDVACADVICSDFLAKTAHGASTGRAFLVARQNILANNASIDPFQLKTLAQFMLLGDPSYRAHTPADAPALLANALEGHYRRRRHLTAIGATLKFTTAVPRKLERPLTRADDVRDQLHLPEALHDAEFHVMRVEKPCRPADARPGKLRPPGYAFGAHAVVSNLALADCDGDHQPAAAMETLAIASASRRPGDIMAVVARLVGGKVTARHLIASR